MLLAADLLALTTAFAVVEAFFRKSQLVGDVGIGVETLIFLGLLPIWVLAAKLYGLYDRDEDSATHSTADEVVSVFHLVTAGVWVFYATSWLVGLWNPDQAKLATFWFLALVSVVVARSGARTLARRQSAYVQNALIVGAGEVGQLIAVSSSSIRSTASTSWGSSMPSPRRSDSTSETCLCWGRRRTSARSSEANTSIA